MTTKFAGQQAATTGGHASMRQLNRRLAAWVAAFAVFAAAFWVAFLTDANVFLLQAAVLATAVGALWTLHQREHLQREAQNSHD